jgi:hypothetical protein
MVCLASLYTKGLISRGCFMKDKDVSETLSIRTEDIQYFRVNEPQSLFHNVCINKIIGVPFVHGHIIVFLFYGRDKFLAPGR